MNVFQPWNVVFLIGLVVYIKLRHVYIQRLKLAGQKKVVSRLDAAEKTLLLGMTIGVFVLPVLYLFTPILGFADYQLPRLVPWFGILLLVVSLWLFWRSHEDLGLNWSVSLELREGHQLVSNGVYRTIRHPMYASIWLWVIAQGMLLQNWLAGWSAVVAFAAMYFLRVPREEKMMSELFGNEYREYMQRTGRIFPQLKPTK